MTNPPLSILSRKVIDADWNPQIIIYPTLKSPAMYDRDKYRFWATCRDDFTCNPESRTLKFWIRGRPLPQKRSYRGRNGNMVSESKSAQNELASLIENLLKYRNGGEFPTWYRDSHRINLNCLYVFPAGSRHPAVCADIDNLQKFVFDAFQTSGLIRDDADIQCSKHKKVTDHFFNERTYFLRETGGYYFGLNCFH